MATDDRPGKNAEGYADPTAAKAIRKVMREERQKREAERQEAISALVHAIRDIAGLAGFEVIGRIAFKDKETGKEYR